MVPLRHSRRILGYHLNHRRNLGGGFKERQVPLHYLFCLEIVSLATELKLFTTIGQFAPSPPTVVGQFTRMIQTEPKQVPSSPFPVYHYFLTRDIIVN